MELGFLKTGELVVDRANSHLHESVKPLLSEGLLKINGGDDFIVSEVDFQRIIGESICVETTDRDNENIYFIQRNNREYLTRMVRNRLPEPTSRVTVILKKIEVGYIMITAFIGSKPEPEPWDRNRTAKSEEFWSTHAMIEDK